MKTIHDYILDTKLDIYEKEAIGEITKSEMVTLLTTLYEKEEEYGIIDEGFKDIVTNIAKKAGDSYVSGMNKRGEAVANTFVKKPSEGSSPEVYKQYQNKFNKVKVAYKVGEIMVASTIAIGPIDWLLKAAMAQGMAHSSDPTDKIVMDKIKMLKEKMVNLVNKVKGKKITKENFSSPLQNIEMQGANIARKIDANKGKVKPSAVRESTMNIDSSNKGTFYESMMNIIQTSDYTVEGTFEMIDGLLNI